MRVYGYALPQVQIEGINTKLYPHQAAMFQEWCDSDAFMLITKTGSGKTRAVALPILKRKESAVFVYPTNALIADQSQAIRQLMDDEEISFQEWTPETAEKVGDEEYIIIQVNADLLEQYRKEWHLSQKGDALLRLLQQDKRKIILINPDILFLILTLNYGRSHEVLGSLQAYTTVVFDEFHLYGGTEFAHALFLIFLARQLKMFSRVVLLSATPNEEVTFYLSKILRPKIIDGNVNILQQFVGTRQVAHDVELKTMPGKRDLIKTVHEKVFELIDELRDLQHKNEEANKKGQYIPCIVILNSVVQAIALEDRLVESGISRDDIAPVRGLSARSARDLRGKLIVIGTAAIEVGIDFQADYLIFEAGDGASFLQRFGRIGRHNPGVAFLIGDHHECAGIESIGESISRDQLQSAVNAIYPQQNARTWFVATFGGIVTVSSQAYNFKKAIVEDFNADHGSKEKILRWLDEVLDKYADLLDATKILTQVRGYYKRKKPWLDHYSEIQLFRTSLPTQTVWDVKEKLRGRREWNYEADVKTLLFRAERLWFNDKHQRLYVKGYGALHRVWFFKSFENEIDSFFGTIRTTSDYERHEMIFLQDGHPTSVSHVMSKPRHHIFVVVPYEQVRNEIDWRIAWFWCGKSGGRNIIAFDGDALLLKEIWNRVHYARD